MRNQVQFLSKKKRKEKKEKRNQIQLIVNPMKIIKEIFFFIYSDKILITITHSTQLIVIIYK